MYTLHWITDYLATGHAPMSYADLDGIRAQGISAIVNLCGEFCDLHEIEESSGFEVYYLPVSDECAPDLEAMEQALDWLDEAIYLKKKVLVHCRLGHGRTGTFIAAYLLRRGFAFKAAEKTLKGRNANPATYAQRSFLKRYGKQVGSLQTAAPRIENRPTGEAVDPLLAACRQLMADHDRLLNRTGEERCCGRGQASCCSSPFDLLLIEAMYFSEAINATLKAGQRQEVITRALELTGRLKELHHRQPGLATDALAAAFPEEVLACPLLEQGDCLVFADRPPRCRYWELDPDSEQARHLRESLLALSALAYERLTGQPLPGRQLLFSSADTISGRFVQLYFQAMTTKNV